MVEESTFDPATFLASEVAGEMEINYTPVPAGDYVSMIDDITARQVTTDRGTSIVLDVTHLIDNPEVAEKLGMERLTVRQGLFLDVEPNGAIALGPNKNVKLGRLRAAVGQNGAGPWNFAMLKGAGPLRLGISVVPDKKDPSIPRNQVDRTLPMAAIPGGTGGEMPRAPSKK